MEKKKKLSWQLSSLPTPDEIVGLVKNNIITQEEAKEILFKTESEVEVKDLKNEIKFLKKLVEKLSEKNNTTIIESIRYIEKPYVRHDWYGPYANWYGNNTLVCDNQDNQGLVVNPEMNHVNCSFSEIK